MPLSERTLCVSETVSETAELSTELLSILTVSLLTEISLLTTEELSEETKLSALEGSAEEDVSDEESSTAYAKTTVVINIHIPVKTEINALRYFLDTEILLQSF